MNYPEEFIKTLEDIEKLISTPNDIRDLILKSFDGINFSCLGYTLEKRITNSLIAIKNISEKSFAKSYAIIYNQACILSVTSLSVYLEKYFNNRIKSRWDHLNFDEKNNIKLSLQEIAEFDFKITANLGEIVLRKDSSVNFQDIGSTFRSFKHYLLKDIENQINPDIIRDIIFYQQCRHILVHKNGIADGSFLKRINNANKKNYTTGNKIQLNQEDWDCIKKSFTNFLEKATEKID